jgi:hypothetical protein
MTERDKPIMPLFVFERRRDIELEAGFVLAGQLIIDIPKRPKPKRCHALLVERIVRDRCPMGSSSAGVTARSLRTPLT